MEQNTIPHEEAWMTNQDGSQEYGTLKFYSKYEILQAINAGKTEAVLLELDRLLRSVSKYDCIPEEFKEWSDDYTDSAIARLEDVLKDENTSECLHILISIVRTYIARNASHIFEDDI